MPRETDVCRIPLPCTIDKHHHVAEGTIAYVETEQLCACCRHCFVYGCMPAPDYVCECVCLHYTLLYVCAHVCLYQILCMHLCLCAYTRHSACVLRVYVPAPGPHALCLDKADLCSMGWFFVYIQYKYLQRKSIWLFVCFFFLSIWFFKRYVQSRS